MDNLLYPSPLPFAGVHRLGNHSATLTEEEASFFMDFEPSGDKTIFKFKLILEDHSGGRHLIKNAYIFTVTEKGALAISNMTVMFLAFLVQDTIRSVNRDYKSGVSLEDGWLLSHIRGILGSPLN